MNRMRKTALATLAAASILATSARANAVCGDVNGDGNVTVADALALAGVVAAAGDCGANKPNCDVRKDNVIDIQDLTNLVAQLAQLDTLFAACTGPGPAVACSGAVSGETGRPTQTIAAGDITSNQTWPSNCEIHLTGIVNVKTLTGQPKTVLTIQPGTLVRGEAGGTANPAVLIIYPGAKIDAQGTPSAPIIMTSGNAVGTRAVGDWGGLVINGQSTVNRPNCLANAEGIPAPYGGCNEKDSSGIITYTRVEFSGIEFTPNNELNIVTMNGVGSGTVMNHIQGNAGGDDCLEWFGGTVNVKYMVSSGCADDGFDYQLGTTGARQYGLAVQYGPVMQTGNQSRGIEADNSEFGPDDLPRSNPKFCNLTMIGARDNDPNLGSQGGLFFRRGTAGEVANSLVLNYRDGCVRLDDATTARFACDNPTTLHTTEPFLSVDSTVCYDNGGTGAVGTAKRSCAGVTSGGNCTASEYYHQLASNNDVVPDNGTCSVTVAQRCCQNSDCPAGETCTGTATGPDPAITGWGTLATRWDDVLASGGGGGYPTTVPDVHPTSTAGFPTAIDCHGINDFMDTTNFIGAFDGTTNWLDTPVMAGTAPISLRRWISFDTN